MSGVARTTTTEDGVEGRVAEPPGEHAHRTRRLRYSLPGARGRPGLRVPVALAVAAAPHRRHPGPGLRHHRRDRLRRRCGRRMGVARLRRPGSAAHQRRSWRSSPSSLCCLVAAMTFGRYWQGQIRMRMGVAPDGLSSLLVTPLLAALVFVALIALGPHAARPVPMGSETARAVDRATCSTRRGLDRGRGGDRTARQRSAARRPRGCSRRGLLSTQRSHRTGASSSRSLLNGPGAQNPRCRGRRSARQGRTFTGTGPTPWSRSRPSGRHRANMPVRAYAGLDSAATAEQRARLAVDDLSTGRRVRQAAPSWWSRPLARVGRPGRG